jgi:hypothetical protein
MRTALLMFTLLAGVVAGAAAHAMLSAHGAIPALEPAGAQPAYYCYRTYRPCYRIYRPYVARRSYYHPRCYRRCYVVPY